MGEEATFRDHAILVVMCVFPVLGVWIIVAGLEKIRDKFPELPLREIPASAYIPLAASFYGLGFLIFFLVIGLSHLPF